MEIHHVGEFVSYYANLRKRTMNVVNLIPRDRIEWTYREGKFTFGDLLRHLASIELYMYAENAQLKPSRYPGHGRELAEGYDAVLDYFDEMHRQSMDIFRGLTPEDLQRRCETPG